MSIDFIPNHLDYAHAERLTAGCMLSAVGGFLDVYTYLYRGKVFANAVTGNMVLLGLHFADFQWLECGKYLLTILFYALGVFAAELIHKHLPASRWISWHQRILLLEIVFLSIVNLIPYGKFDFVVTVLIALVCALQVQTFRRVRGLPFASTMCTGNLRSGTEALFRYFCKNMPGEWHTAIHYYSIIACFILGASLGAVLLRHFGTGTFLLAPCALLAVFFLITERKQER